MSQPPRSQTRQRQTHGRNGEQAVHLYNEGVSLQAQGKTGLAESAFRRALSLQPGFAEAHNNLGNILLEQKKWKAAEKSFRRALELAPDHAMLLGNIGKALYHQGKTAAAQKTLLQAIRLDPRAAMAMHTLGTLLMECGRTDEALGQFQQAHELLPESPQIATSLGGALHRLERYEEAVDILHATVKAQPRYFAAYPTLADAACEVGAVDDAIRILHEAVRLAPDNDAILARLARIYYSKWRYLEARSAISRAIDLSPETAGYYSLLGRTLHKLNLLGEAERAFGKAIDLEPRNADHHYRLGRLLLACGERETAEQAFRQTIKLQPENALACEGLAQARRPLEPIDARKMQTLLHDQNLSDKDRVSLHFGLGMHFDAQADYASAYPHISKGNALTAAGASPAADILADKKRLAALFSGDLINSHRKSGHRDSTPIFITGLSRSGKTVMEKILARHSLVTAGGESSDYMHAVHDVLSVSDMKAFPECVRDLPDSTFTDIGRVYTARMQKSYPDTARVTNTSPANAWHIGMIRLCLPNAKIIVCQREARDNCTGIFNKNLGEDHPYSFDMHALGAYYRQHTDLIEQWRNLLPDFIHVVQFEELLRDPQPQIEAVLDFCGLPVEAACLEATRLPKPDAVIGIWKHYREHLAPLYEMLGT